MRPQYPHKNPDADEAKRTHESVRRYTCRCGCESCKEQIAWLEGELGIVIEAEREDIVRRAFGVTRQQAQVALALYDTNRLPLTTIQLEERIPSPRGLQGERDYKQLICVRVCQLRRAAGRDFIETINARGFRLSPSGMAMMDALLKPKIAEAA